MYMLGSLAISVAVPDSSLELTSGRVTGLHHVRRRVRRPGRRNILSGLLVIGAFAASIAWIAGPSRSMWLVGRAGYLPRGLQKTNKNDVQMPLLLLQGAVVTVLALVFVVAPNTSSAFALLQDMSVILYMGMYVFMFASVIKLRRSQPDRERPIKIPGLPVVAGVGMIAACRDRARPDAARRILVHIGDRVRPDRRRRRDRPGHPAAVHLPHAPPIMERRRATASRLTRPWA